MRTGLSLLAAFSWAGCGTPSPSEPGPLETFPADSSADIALEFDGDDDYASLGTAGFPFARLPHTISFWLKPAPGAAEQVIVTLNKDAESGVLLGLSNGVPTARSAYSGDLFVQAASAIPNGEWHHVAYLFDGTDSAPHHTLYVDGAVAGTGTLLPDKRTPTTAYIGADSHAKRCYRGGLDELRVWAVARAPELVRAEFAGEAPEQEPPELVLYYSFDEASGARVVDRSGRGNHALLGDGLASYMPKRALSGVAQARASISKP